MKSEKFEKFYDLGPRLQPGIRIYTVNPHLLKVFHEDSLIGYVRRSDKGKYVKYGALLWDPEQNKLSGAKTGFNARGDALKWVSSNSRIVV